ncbi:MAG: alpha,alpha-phosphotrehalase, partial [Sebaldella sp.]|nr:alpha,alpha-phosphotrehalase [Sebaldella sp.]
KKDEGLEEKEIIEILKQKSRDNSRTPLQWNSEKNSGFTSGVPWINTAANYKDINVEKALENKESIYYFYRRLIKLRKEEEILIEGKYEDIDIENKNVYAYKRSFKNDELIVIANFYSTECNFNISDNLLEYKILISNYNNIRLDSSNIIKLRPYESIMLKKIN